MLTCTGLRDDPFLAQPLRQQDLPDRIVDLMRPGMIKVFALQKDLRVVFMRSAGRPGTAAKDVRHSPSAGNGIPFEKQPRA